jgi:hypothetical protein
VTTRRPTVYLPLYGTEARVLVPVEHFDRVKVYGPWWICAEGPLAGQVATSALNHRTGELCLRLLSEFLEELDGRLPAPFHPIPENSRPMLH